MQQCLDFGWCENLAAHLVDVWIDKYHDHPVFVHRGPGGRGLCWNVWEITGTTRRQFSIYNVLADNSNRQYPNPPPAPVSLDSRRPLPKLAAAPKGHPQRRLIDPGLIWFVGATAWRIQDAAAQQR